MPQTYALQIRKSDLALITMLNDGIVPPIPKSPTYLVFSVTEDGREVTSKIMPERECFQTYEIAGHSPFMLRLKS